LWRRLEVVKFVVVRGNRLHGCERSVQSLSDSVDARVSGT
jgi:hypothetical protein